MKKDKKKKKTKNKTKNKRRIKKSIKKKIFYTIIAINIVWILSLICYYSYRLVYYYKLEHKQTADTNYLVDTLILEKNLVTKDSGLYKEDDGYRYKGNATNNYLYYSGLLWRIIDIDKNHNIKIVTEENMTTLSYGGTDFMTSDVYKWLNYSDKANTGIFYQNLNDIENIITKTNLCYDVVETLTEVKCKDKKGVSVGLLTLHDYEESKGKNGYLNNGNIFYTASVNSEEEVWTIQKDGSVFNVSTENNGNGIRPVITLKATTKRISGDGTKESPYKIENNKKTVLADTNVGEYITYSGNRYRIIGKDSNNVKVMLDSVLKNKHIFSNVSTTFDLTEYGSLAYFLNYENIGNYKNPDWLKEGTFYTGMYHADTNYSYITTYQNKVKSTIGLPQVGDYFVGDYDGIYILNPSSIDDNTIVSIENGKYYADLIGKEKSVRPVLYLDGTVKIKGNGTKNKPYELGV